MFKEISSLTKFSIVLFIGFLMLVTTFTVNFNWPNDIVYVDRFIYLNRFFTDFFQVCAAIILLGVFGRVGRVLGLVLAVVFVVIYFIQSESYANIGKYLPAIALENAEHADFLELDNIIFSGALWLFFTVLFLRTAKRQLVQTSWKAILLVSLVLLILSVAIKNDKDWLSKETVENRFDFYNSGRAGVQRKSPMGELVETYNEHLEYLRKQNFLSGRADVLTKGAADFAFENFDYFAKEDEEFPLIRTTKFSRANFLPDKELTGTAKKNIIIFFAEGISARLVQPYSYLFPGLTPNIEKFARSTIKVNNYFSHTYATYRGLGGQLCSIYPVGRLYAEVNYYCLGHALKEQGYATRFMVSQRLDKTDLDQVADKSGIQEVDGVRNLLKLSTDSQNYQNANIVPDRVLIDGLIKRLEGRKNDGQPFMIGLYNFETHTGVKLLEEPESYYGSLEEPIQPNYVLDTFHNFDREFGRFWSYFKGSQWFENTIVILTTDHATFPSKDFIELMQNAGAKGYAPIFVDRIPFLIYHPDIKEQIELDAATATSLNFAPSVLNLLEIKSVKAPFLGESIFSGPQKRPHGGTAGGAFRLWHYNEKHNFWLNVHSRNVDKVRIHTPLKANRWEFIKYAESLERSNHLWKK